MRRHVRHGNTLLPASDARELTPKSQTPSGRTHWRERRHVHRTEDRQMNGVWSCLLLWRDIVIIAMVTEPQTGVNDGLLGLRHRNYVCSLNVPAGCPSIHPRRRGWGVTQTNTHVPTLSPGDRAPYIQPSSTLLHKINTATQVSLLPVAKQQALEPESASRTGLLLPGSAQMGQ